MPPDSTSPTSRPAAAGANTRTPAVPAAAAPPSATPATAGGPRGDKSRAAGATTSRRSRPRSTKPGKRSALPSAPPSAPAEALPSDLALCAALFFQLGALEIVAFVNSPLRVRSLDADQLDTDPGDWLLVRLPSTKAAYRRVLVEKPDHGT